MFSTQQENSANNVPSPSSADDSANNDLTRPLDGSVSQFTTASSDLDIIPDLSDLNTAPHNINNTLTHLLPQQQSIEAAKNLDGQSNTNPLAEPVDNTAEPTKSVVAQNATEESNNSFAPANKVAPTDPSTDNISAQNAILAPNANYRIELAPLTFDISKNLDQIKNNTIVLKKEKSGLIKAYLVRDGKVAAPVRDLGLSAAENNVLLFPTAGETPVKIEREEFPELVDKVCMRCGIRSARSFIGTVLALVFSLGCGVTTVAAFFKMLFAASVTLTPGIFVIAGGIGLSTFVANYRMSQFDLPEMFLAGYNYLFRNRYLKKDDHGNVIKDQNGKVTYEARNIPGVRLALLAFGALSSFFLGVAFAVLTYTATINLPTAFAFLAPFAPILPIVGVVLGGATLISLSLIMFKATSDLLKSDTLVDSLAKIRDNLFHFDAKKDQGFVGHAKRIGIWLVFGVVTLAAVGLTFLGAIYTQIACVGSINDTFKITSDLIKGFTAAVVGGLAFLAQVPFTVITTVNPILQFFYRWPEKPVVAATEAAQQDIALAEAAEIDPNDPPGAAKGLWWLANTTLLGLGALASLVNAVANGLIALDGRKFSLNTYEGVGTVGAIGNSFFSTLGNTIPRSIPEKVEAAEVPPQHVAIIPQGGSSAAITATMQAQPGNPTNTPVNTDDRMTSVETLTADNNPAGQNDKAFDAPQNEQDNSDDTEKMLKNFFAPSVRVM